MTKREEQLRRMYAHADANRVPDELIGDVAPLTEAQKDDLRVLGRTGALAAPHSGLTLDEAPLGERLWRFNWHIWMGQGLEHLRFADPRKAESEEAPR